MVERISQLKLVWRTRPGSERGTDGRYGGQTERQYLDFFVDGKSLGELLQVGDMISCLGWGKPEYEEESAQILGLKKLSLLETGRIMFYVCPECGDIGCGAITARIEESAEQIVWQNFGYENDYDPTVLDLAEYKEFGPYVFNKTEYLNALNYKPDRFAA